jgi:drug/metabolite transporter (DMT)-like permease
VLGVLAIGGACLAWAVDNNVTQRLALRDPVRLVQVKAGVAASGSAVLAVATHARFPGPGYAAMAIVLGGCCFGSSIVLDVWALRVLGAARESVLFASAPFVGAVLSIVVLSERPRPSAAVAAAAMTAGVLLMHREDHEHAHEHQPIEHDHAHVHDLHHRHLHRPDAPPLSGRQHTHLHQHVPIRHAHAHGSDAHHRHGH